MNLLAAVALIAILVFIHEFGHFIVAKACGVAVPVFSFGFGRRLVGIKIGGTDYRISAIPLGGYVRMAGADPHGYVDEDDELEDPSRGFLQRPLWQRILVILAGPAFNLVLPFVVFTLLLMGGEPQPISRIGDVLEQSPAASAGLAAGDLVDAVNGAPTPGVSEFYSAIGGLPPGETALQVRRGDQELSLTLSVPETLGEGGLGISMSAPDTTVGIDDPRSPAALAGMKTGDHITHVGDAELADWIELNAALSAVQASTVALRLERGDDTHTLTLSRTEWSPSTGVRAPQPAERWGMATATLFIATVQDEVGDENGFMADLRPTPATERAPAALAGIKAGDHLISVDGAPLHRWGDVTRLIRASMQGEGDTATARPVTVGLVRDGETLELSMTPKIIENTNAMGLYEFRPIIGVSSAGAWARPATIRRYYGPIEAMGRASDETVAIAGLIVDHLGKLFTGEAAFDKAVGSPIEMVRQASKAAERGVFDYARMMGMLSLSLGIVNLLPVPVLDGGQLLFFLLEAIRGRPVSIALRERALQVGVLVMVLLMLVVLVKDVSALVGDFLGRG